MNPHVIITNMKKRYSGVSGTVNALLPVQAKTLSIGFVGTDLPGAQLAKRIHSDTFFYLSVWQAIWISRKLLPNGQPRIWHVRRDPEMMLVIFCITPTSSRPVIRTPVRKDISLFLAHLVFTTLCP
jgi:mannosyltransferase